MIPKGKILVSTGGVFLTKALDLKYCHIERIHTLNLEEHSFVAIAYIVHKNGMSETVRMKLFYRREQNRYSCYKYSYV